MPTEEQLQNVAGVVQTAETILVMLSSDPTFDQVAVATSLVLSLVKKGKKATLHSPVALAEEHLDLVGADQVSDKLGNKNLHVIFEYQPEAIDKVSYHINEENNKFYLVIQPQAGYSPLDPKTVEYDLGGAEADLIILVGINALEDLDQLYQGFENLYQDAATISINNFETKVANINLDFSSQSCLSEGIVSLLKTLEAEFDGDIATNLLAGIEDKTSSFHSLTTSADTFAITAELMKAGARRIRRKTITKVSNLKKSGEVEGNLKLETKKKKKEESLRVSRDDSGGKKTVKPPKVGGLDHKPSEGSIGV